jgi:hypothetical protein
MGMTNSKPYTTVKPQGDRARSGVDYAAPKIQDINVVLPPRRPGYVGARTATARVRSHPPSLLEEPVV